MSVRIRLQRGGRKKKPFYQIVVADSRAPRDGKFIEKIGSYNPLTKPATIEIDREKAFDWLMKGAEPTPTVRAILRFKGVYYRKHLMRGVKKGAITIEEAEAKYLDWIQDKEAKIAARTAKAKEEKEAYHVHVFGIKPEKPVVAVVEETKIEEEVVETNDALPEVESESNSPVEEVSTEDSNSAPEPEQE